MSRRPRRAPRGLRVAPLVVAALALAAGCNRTVDEDECKALVAKLVDLIAASDSSDHVGKVKSAVKGDPRASSLSRETCVGKITKSQYECMMSAKSVEAFAACDAR